MLLSYIIPVFNTEKFLIKCLDSILSQNLSYDKYEIIVINDGSTDSSDQLFNNWRKEFPHINTKYLVQVNQGLSSSRNLGIKNAIGDYIWFIDSDDYLLPDVAKLILHEAIQDNLDVLWFDHILVNSSGKNLDKPSVDIKDGLSEKVMKGPDFLTTNFRFSCMVCFFLIKRDFLLKNNLFFLKGIYFEDIVFTPQMIYRSERIKFTPVVTYNYLIHENSIMRGNINQKKRIMDSLIVVKNLLVFSDKENNSALSNYIERFTGAILLYNYRLSISMNDKLFLKSFKSELRNMNLFPFTINRPFQRMLLAKLANLSPYFFEKIIQIRPIK